MTNDIRPILRESRRHEALGPDARCSVCDEQNILVLGRFDGAIVCYECRTRATGRSGLEAHHIDGRSNSADTIELPANEHRILSELQREWPEETLRNPDGSPLLQAAARMRGFLDMLKLMIDRVLGWIPAFLEGLDAALQQQCGRYWWQSAPFAACFGAQL